MHRLLDSPFKFLLFPCEMQGELSLHQKPVNPLYPNISMQILLIVLYAFPKVLTREFVQQSRAALVGDSFLYSPMFNSDVILLGEIRCQ